MSDGAAATRTPTSGQKAKEAAVLYTSLADLAIVVLMFIFAVATHSLTLLSEAVRVALMLVVEFYSLLLLRAVHRDRLRKFRFGIQSGSGFIQHQDVRFLPHEGTGQSYLLPLSA